MSRNRIEQHPDEYRQDLNPDYRAGNNDPSYQPRLIPASEIKDITQVYNDLRHDELRRIPIVAEGERLEQGACYFDLRYPERGEFKAVGGMEAGPRNWYVPKAFTDYELWNLITGVGNPDRLGGLTQQTRDST
jgi:hypothetical protein